jgi:hypothetical protein
MANQSSQHDCLTPRVRGLRREGAVEQHFQIDGHRATAGVHDERVARRRPKLVDVTLCCFWFTPTSMDVMMVVSCASAMKSYNFTRTGRVHERDLHDDPGNCSAAMTSNEQGISVQAHTPALTRNVHSLMLRATNDRPEPPHSRNLIAFNADRRPTGDDRVHWRQP